MSTLSKEIITLSIPQLVKLVKKQLGALIDVKTHRFPADFWLNYNTLPIVRGWNYYISLSVTASTNAEVTNKYLKITKIPPPSSPRVFSMGTLTLSKVMYAVPAVGE